MPPLHKETEAQTSSLAYLQLDEVDNRINQGLILLGEADEYRWVIGRVIRILASTFVSFPVCGLLLVTVKLENKIK